MRAAVLRGPNRLALEIVAIPAVGPADALLRVHACGVCGSDLRALKTGLRVDRPAQILGHEVSGEVVAKGAQVNRVNLGERLAFAADLACGECWYCRHDMQNLCEHHRILGAHVPGGLADYMLLTADLLEHATYHRIPAGVSWQAAAMAEPVASVIAAQDMAGVGPGHVVAIMGSGPIGCLHFELARSRGATPVLVGRNRSRLDFARGLVPGATVIDSTGENTTQTLRAMTEGRGADVAIIAAPSGELQAEALGLVRKRGTVVLFGGLPKSTPMVAFDANAIHYRELRVIGAFSYQRRHHARALELIADGTLSADRYCSAYSLSDLETMFADAAAGRVMKALAIAD